MSNVICYSCDYFRKNEELRKENDKLRKHLKTALGTLKKICRQEPVALFTRANPFSF